MPDTLSVLNHRKKGLVAADRYVCYNLLQRRFVLCSPRRLVLGGFGLEAFARALSGVGDAEAELRAWWAASQLVDSGRSERGVRACVCVRARVCACVSAFRLRSVN